MVRNYTKYIVSLLVVGTILVGFGIRLKMLFEYPVWLDEATVTIEAFQRSYADLFLLNYWDVAHPPLYNVFLKLWTSLVGASPFWLRLPSILASVISLLVLYKLVRVLTGSRISGLLAAAIVSVSGFFISLSIFARPYGFEQLWVVLFLLTGLNTIRRRIIGKADMWKVFIVSSLASLTDYSFVWLLGSIILWYLFCIFRGSVNQLKNWGIRGIIALVLPYVFWLLVFVQKFAAALSLESYLKYKSELAHFFTATGWVVRGAIIMSPTNIEIHVWLWIVLSVLLLIWLLFSKQKTALFLLIVWVVPISVAYVFSYFISSILLPKNLFVVMYVPVISICLLFMWVRRNHPRWTLLPTLLCGIFIWFSYKQIPEQLSFGVNTAGLGYAQSLSKYSDRFIYNPSTISVLLTSKTDYEHLYLYYLLGYFQGRIGPVEIKILARELPVGQNYTDLVVLADSYNDSEFVLARHQFPDCNLIPSSEYKADPLVYICTTMKNED